MGGIFIAVLLAQKSRRTRPPCLPWWICPCPATQVNRKVGNLTSLAQKSLNRSSPKFAWVITSGTLSPMHNFSTIRLSPFPPNMQKCASSDSVFFVFPSPYSQDPCTDFHDQYVKWRRFAQGCAFWVSDPISPPNANFWPFLTGQNFAPKSP